MDGLSLFLGMGAGALALILKWAQRRLHRGRPACVYCATPRGRWARLRHPAGLCAPCRRQQRYAVGAGLEPIYHAALARAWDAHAYGPDLWRRVGTALFYGGLARQRAPQVGEAAAIAEAAALGAALGRLVEREGR